MNETKRSGEYEGRGDYHRELDPAWSYAPIYKRKVEWVDRFVQRLPADSRLVDVGCGEGAFVERYAARGMDTLGVDVDYESERVRRASLLSLPFDEASFNAALCLDVLEHISLPDQPTAIAEIRRVLTPGGRLLVTVPNLAHLHSRLRFLFWGRFTRTSAIERHPGDRPMAEYIELLQKTGFTIGRRGGIFPTVPFLFRLVNRQTERFGWLVPWLDRLLPVPGWCFLSVIEATRL